MAPVVRWKKTYNSTTIYKTPVNRSDYEDALTKLGGRPNTWLETDAEDGAPAGDEPGDSQRGALCPGR